MVANTCYNRLKKYVLTAKIKSIVTLDRLVRVRVESSIGFRLVFALKLVELVKKFSKNLKNENSRGFEHNKRAKVDTHLK
jgi:hypothetical protein